MKAGSRKYFAVFTTMDFGQVVDTETTLVTSNVLNQYNLITFLSRASRNPKEKIKKLVFLFFP
jgi:hypothetical protein